MPQKRPPIDWFAFSVHFCCGAIIGGLIGLSIWGRPNFGLYNSRLAGLICIGGGALLGGLLAGCGRESFWDSFGR